MTGLRILRGTGRTVDTLAVPPAPGPACFAERNLWERREISKTTCYGRINVLCGNIYKLETGTTPLLTPIWECLLRAPPQTGKTVVLLLAGRLKTEPETG